MPWGTRKAASQGPIYPARSVPAWHVSTRRAAFKRVDAISAYSAEASKIGGDAAESASLSGATAQDMGTLGPRSKLLKVSESAASAEDILAVAYRGAKLNVLRNADASVRSVAPGVRCCGLLRGAKRRAHFPPTEEGVLAW